MYICTQTINLSMRVCVYNMNANISNQNVQNFSYRATSKKPYKIHHIN